jgi:hypothetical protein
MSCNVYQGVARRKYISWKTKYAAALLKLGDVPYSDAKLMTEDQIISLYRVDHNILHETGHPLRDSFWNLTPMLILAHKEKTRHDATVIAKSRRIRAWNEPRANWAKQIAPMGFCNDGEPQIDDAAARVPKLRTGPDETAVSARGTIAGASRPARTRAKVKEQSLARQGRVRPGKVRSGEAGHGVAWQGKAGIERKIPSRPFDRRFKKRFDGTVVKRET